jgi:ABC-type sugar transport system ATPase subunit
VATVQLEGVAKHYGKVVAVAGVDLTIRDQELVVLVGPSGCGKTTTLRLIAGLEETSLGTIHIGDRLVNDVEPKDRNIAMVFQDYALYPHMTVFDNIGFSLKLKGIPKKAIRERVTQTAESLGIGDLLARRPGQLSGGQRQRVAMGRAIIREPDVFLFDEPLSNLDANLRVQMRLEIARLHRELGATIVYVTHDQVEAMTLADRIVVMNDGLVQQIGTPLEVFEHPSNAFVAGFIGSPSMNLLPVTVDVSAAMISGDGFELPIDDLRCRLLREAGQDQVTLGIRPQHLAPTSDPSAPAIETVIDVVEPMGTESFLYATAGARLLVGRTDETPPAVGSICRLRVDLDWMHLFLSDGSRLTREGQKGSPGA